MHDNLVVHPDSLELRVQALHKCIIVEHDHEVAGNLVNVTWVGSNHGDVIADVNRDRSQEIVVPILAADLILDFIVVAVQPLSIAAIPCAVDCDHWKSHLCPLLSIFPILQHPRLLVKCADNWDHLHIPLSICTLNLDVVEQPFEAKVCNCQLGIIASYFHDWSYLLCWSL